MSNSAVTVAIDAVASGQDLKGIVRAKAAGQALPDLPLTRGWRADAILPELLAVLDGSHALRVVKPSSTAPLAYLPVSASIEETLQTEEPSDDTAETASLPLEHPPPRSL